MPQYRLAAKAEADQLDRPPKCSRRRCAQNIQRASNYVLGVVLFAVALFFAGMARGSPRAVSEAMLVGGCRLFVGTVIWIATFPVNVAV